MVEPNEKVLHMVSGSSFMCKPLKAQVNGESGKHLDCTYSLTQFAFRLQIILEKSNFILKLEWMSVTQIFWVRGQTCSREKVTAERRECENDKYEGVMISLK